MLFEGHKRMESSIGLVDAVSSEPNLILAVKVFDFLDHSFLCLESSLNMSCIAGDFAQDVGCCFSFREVLLIYQVLAWWCL